MSGKPHPEGVTLAISIASEMNTLAPEIHRLREEVTKLAGLEDRYARLNAQLQKHLETMDLDTRGNFGWQARFGWFIGELVRQMSVPERKKTITTIEGV